jgi:hypothetical protein
VAIPPETPVGPTDLSLSLFEADCIYLGAVLLEFY